MLAHGRGQRLERAPAPGTAGTAAPAPRRPARRARSSEATVSRTVSPPEPITHEHALGLRVPAVVDEVVAAAGALGEPRHRVLDGVRARGRRRG